MAIESTYREQSGKIAARKKKEDRNLAILQAGNIAIDAYKANQEQRNADFFNRTEVLDQRLKYKEGFDLFENKIKPLYEQGTNSAVGLGEHLVSTVAMPIAKERLYANVEEDMVFDPDDLGNAVNVYAREMVYGKDGQEGMLARLEKAYNSGKTLAGMDKYDEYVNRRADLPENLGRSLINKVFRGRSREDIEQDAIQKIAQENKYTEKSEEFLTLAKAYDAGMTVRDAEKLSETVKEKVKDLKMKPDEILHEVKRIKAPTRKIGGQEVEWYYMQPIYKNSRTGALRNGTAYADPADPVGAKIFNNESVEIKVQGEEEEVVDPLLGVKVKRRQTQVISISGETLGVKETISGFSDPDLGGIDAATQVSEEFKEASKDRLNSVLNTNDPDSVLRDGFNDYLNQFAGDDEENKEKAMDLALGKMSVVGYNIHKQYGMPLDLARKVGAVIFLEDVRYRMMKGNVGDNYQGANITMNKKINGLRVLEGLNRLVMTQPDLAMNMTKDNFNELIGDLVSENNILEFVRPRTGGGSRFTDRTRKHFVDINQPQDRTNINNLFNRELKPGYTIMDYIRERADLRLLERKSNQKLDNEVLDLTGTQGQI